MPVRSLLSLLLLALVTSTVHADTTIVDDDFESYANDTALYSVWEPRNAGGDSPPEGVIDNGILTNETLDPGLFPGIEGNAVDHIANAESVMQFTGLNPDNPISPSSTESIRMSVDIYVGNDGNSRMSMGLRNRSVPESLIELGTWNADATDPFDGTTVIPATTYGYRLILFSDIGDDLAQNPNWQFFQFDLALDVDDSNPATTEPTPDGKVNPIDIGAGWHTYSATITEDTITVEIDLYRDGLDNGATITAGSDVAGIDASITYDITTAETGYDSLRLGPPSGVSSLNGVAFDNVSLELLDVDTGGNTDADGDGDVDGADFLQLQRDNPALIAQWELDYDGNGPLLGANSVPEPLSGTLALLAVIGLLTVRRS